MAFESCLIELNTRSPQSEAPTGFICFNLEEADVGRWAEHILVPDLDKCGIKPIFCFRDLGPGKELNAFQGLIPEADQVIILCTLELKQKCEARKKAPTGVAQEIRLTQERYNDANKWETIFPIYLKGDRNSSCPSVFFEPILGTRFTFLDKSNESSLFSYYASAFELFGKMRGVPREFARELKDEFTAKASQILKGKIDLVALEEWRNTRRSKNEQVVKTAQERVSKLIHLTRPGEF